MRIVSVVVSRQSYKTDKKNAVTFGTYNPTAARKIEEELARKGISCNVRGNDFVAECYKKTVEVFEKLFGSSYLPRNLDFRPLQQGVYGQYGNRSNSVTLNEDYDFKCFYNLDSLKEEANKKYNPVFPSWNSTNHPAHIFVHEFSHAAHWNHLLQRNGEYNASRVWEGLEGTGVPTAIGRLITKFKLSKYAVVGNDMCEFLAERMAKDICNGLTDSRWIPYRDIDVNYSNIFSKNWDYRYSSPQSYIDYFTQQVWDGDIEEANRVGALAALYLAELETPKKVHPMVNTISRTLDYTPTSVVEEEKPLIFKLGSWLSEKLQNANKNLTKNLDNKNKLRIKY